MFDNTMSGLLAYIIWFWSVWLFLGVHYFLHSCIKKGQPSLAV